LEKQPNYHYSVDLTRVSDDKLSITLLVNNMNNDTAYFSFPKMVPGTYSISDFGRFIENLKAPQRYLIFWEAV
jgi:predicted metalloprotease with PDZ domain